jgi:hypothetical protein
VVSGEGDSDTVETPIKLNKGPLKLPLEARDKRGKRSAGLELDKHEEG